MEKKLIQLHLPYNYLHDHEKIEEKLVEAKHIGNVKRRSLSGAVSTSGEVGRSTKQTKSTEVKVSFIEGSDQFKHFRPAYIITADGCKV